jgi:hypothetical protein
MIKYEITNEAIIGKRTKLMIIVIATHGSLLHKEKVEFNKIQLGNKKYFNCCAELMQLCSQEIQKKLILINETQIKAL